MHTGLAGPKMNLSLPLADRYINLTLILFHAIHHAYWVSNTKDEFVSSLSRSVHKFDFDFVLCDTPCILGKQDQG